MSPPEPPAEPPQPKGKSIWWWFLRISNAFWFFLAGVALIAGVGLAQRIGWIEAGGVPTPVAGPAGAASTHTCPMHPQIRQPGAGRCPICGMPLVPATSGSADLDEFAVKVEPAQRRLANIETAEVVKKPVARTIRAIGSIEIDESRQAVIASYIEGRIERLFADYTGVVVAKDDHLAVVYSPELYSAQVEYLEARKTYQQMNSAALASVRSVQQKLVAASRQKLSELGMTEQQISELESNGKAKSRLAIYTTISGTVIEKFAEEGKYISPGEPVYRIANLSTVWLMLELYPEDASQMRFGQVVNATLTSLPDSKLTGRVAFVDPVVDRNKRTVGVRVEFKNPQGRLRPGDYAQATIEVPIGPKGDVYDAELAGKWISPMHPQILSDEPGDCPICGMKLVPTSRYGYTDKPAPLTESIVAPRSALLMAGKQSVAYVETEPGRFELRNVKLGPLLGEEAVVLDGLKPGEMVATAGNFLIDSQMQLAGKPSLIDPSRLLIKPVRNKPLAFAAIDIQRIEDEAGGKLEQLYNAYFEIQHIYTQDKKPTAKQVEKLTLLADELAGDKAFPAEARKQLAVIKKEAAHLHHLPLEKSRQQFKPISHSVVTLATQVRGAAAKEPFHHYFCPMVKKGEGDWLQAKKGLLNPYYGSGMLRCGDHVRTIPPDAKTATPKPREPAVKPPAGAETDAEASPAKPVGADRSAAEKPAGAR